MLFPLVRAVLWTTFSKFLRVSFPLNWNTILSHTFLYFFSYFLIHCHTNSWCIVFSQTLRHILELSSSLCLFATSMPLTRNRFRTNLVWFVRNVATWSLQASSLAHLGSSSNSNHVQIFNPAYMTHPTKNCNS